MPSNLDELHPKEYNCAQINKRRQRLMTAEEMANLRVEAAMEEILEDCLHFCYKGVRAFVGWICFFWRKNVNCERIIPVKISAQPT